MALIASKTGNGAFSLTSDGNSFAVQIETTPPRSFETARQAYDWCVESFADLQGTMRGYSYLNAAFELEEIMS